MRARWALIVDIYETDRSFPILTHIFRGTTQDEALGYYEAHLTTDAFFRGCIERERWRDVPCTSTMHWRRLS